MPGVLMLETLVQVAAILLLHDDRELGPCRLFLRGINDAKFRKQVVPGDQLRLEVTLGRRKSSLAKAKACAYVADQIVAEAELLLGIRRDRVRIDPTARVHPAAQIGEGTTIAPHAIVGEHVRIGRHCTIGASAVVDGWTELGDHTQVFPFASIGLIPQDLKFRGEQTQLAIGRHNIFREFVTIHRGTRGGGGVTQIGDRNLFMAYTHIAHDCQIGNDTIFANGATLAGHVLVEDFATIGAFSGVHQYCRVGRYAFIGGYSVVTKDALPFARTVGNRGRIYGLNTIGLIRRDFPAEVISKLKRAFRYLLQSKLNTSRAIEQIAQDPTLACAEVDYLVEFIRTSQRGVILRRATKRAEEFVADE
jgi:UDP-N-acetylglucosamine acyltransferase